MSAERLAVTFGGPHQHVFLRDARPSPVDPGAASRHADRWTVGRLLAHAADVDRAVPDGSGPLVAVRAHSAAFVFAATLGLWKSGRAPLLVDPALASEPSALQVGGTQLPVLAPAWAADPWADRGVPESGGEPITPAFPGPDSIEVAFFTSGSTGEPKVVVKRSRQMASQHREEAPWLGLTGPVSVLSLVPAFHILGYIYAFSTPAAGRGNTEFTRASSPQAWVARIREGPPRVVVGVPLHFRLMSQVLSEPLPEATYICSGGPLSPAVAEQFHRRAGHEVLQVYGSTETGGIATRIGLGPWRPFPGLRWQVRDADARLLIDSAWQDRPGEWCVTDDVVAPEGDAFRLVGRSDSVVKIGGRRFSIGEVVQSALALPPVEQAHAVVYSRYGEPAVALFVVPASGAPLAPADVRSALASRLASFKVPRTIQVLAELPTRGIGKIDDAALRALAVS